MATTEADSCASSGTPVTYPGVRAIIILTAVAFVVQHLSGFRTNDALTDWMALSQFGVLTQGRLWQLLTYQLLHANFWHILLNMVMLFSFGRELESMVGTRRFVLLYALSGMCGGIGWLALSSTPFGQCIGASGSVLGVAAAYAAIDPGRRLSFIIFPIPWPITMTALNWVLAYGSVTLLLLLWSQSSIAEGMHRQGNVAHAAHLLGGLTGYFYGRRVRQRAQLGLGFPASPVAPGEPELDAAEVDRILEKIQAQGIESLSRHERDVLERASKGGGSG